MRLDRSEHFLGKGLAAQEAREKNHHVAGLSQAPPYARDR